MKEVKVGNLVILLEMKDTQAPPQGTKGIVKHIDDAEQIHVDWEIGGSLAPIPELDEFDVIRIKYRISNEYLEIFKNDFIGEENYFFYGVISLDKVVDIYNNSKKDFFDNIWFCIEKKRITPEEFYTADYQCYNNTEETVKFLLPEVKRRIEQQNRYSVLTTSDAFDYDFIIFDAVKEEYAEKENGEYYLFDDEDSAIKCCEELNRTGLKTN